MVTIKETQSGISELRTRRFLRAQAALKKATDVLIRTYGVKRIILIGSLAEKNRFGFQSDIDLCVEGLPDNLYFKALGDLMAGSEEFDIDIIPFADAVGEMKEKVKRGKVLYEQG